MDPAAVAAYEAGRADQRAERYDDAIADFDRALAIDNTYRAAVSRRAACWRRKGLDGKNPAWVDAARAGYAQAVALPEQGSVASGDDYQPVKDLLFLAYLQRWLRRFDDAAASYAAYLARVPSDVDARFAYANTLWRGGKASDAEATYREALRWEPHRIGARNNLAQLLVVLGRPQEAEALIKAALKDPDADWTGVTTPQEWVLLDTLATASLAMATATGEDEFIRDAMASLDEALASISLPPTAVPGDKDASSYAVMHLRRGYCRARLGTLHDARDSFVAAYRWSAPYSEVRIAAGRNIRRLAGTNLEAWTAPLGPAGVGIAVLALLVLVFSVVEMARGVLDSAAFATIVISSLGAVVLGLLLPRISTFTVGGVQGTVTEVATKTSFELTEISGPGS
jgi:tetratricopeptide (TPR) repeat protein